MKRTIHFAARISTVLALCLIGAIALSPSTAIAQDKPGAPADLQTLEKALGSPDPMVAYQAADQLKTRVAVTKEAV